MHDGSEYMRSGDNQHVAVHGTNNIPVVTIITHKDVHRITPPLHPPCHRYRYTVWHDLRNNQIRGSDLRNPRIRKGPEIKDLTFYTLTDERRRHIHHNTKGVQRQIYEREIENWENCTDVNLSYQELGYTYQLDNFLRVLKRTIQAERVTLIDNELQDLHKITWPRCKELNLHQNYLTRFKDLPKCPALQVLILSDNAINSLDDLGSLARCPLRCLDLRRNPICFTPNYRQRVFYILPNLKELDDIAKLTSDLDYESSFTSYCIIS